MALKVFRITWFIMPSEPHAWVKRASQSWLRGGVLRGRVREAGAGKSRLMYEFKATVPQECKVLEAYSVAQGKVSAWFRSVLKVAPESAFSPK